MDIGNNRLDIYLSEIQTRMKDGVTKPWLCLADDGLSYVVKTLGEIPPQQMVYEWVGCQLAREFGLNTPKVKQIHGVGGAIALLGNPLGFDSNSVSFASEYKDKTTPLTYEQSLQIPANIKHDLFVFDYWIMNGDRTLSEIGGNVNLLYSIPSQELIVFDHNNAFDSELNIDDLLQNHVFAKDNRKHIVDMMDAVEYNDRLNSCISSMGQIVSQMPDEWIEQANDALGCNVIDDKILPILNRCNETNFWGRIR